MSRRLITLAICLLTGSAAQSQQPQAKWQVNIAPAQCTLSGTVDHPGVERVSVSTIPGSDSYTLTLTGDTLHRGSAPSQGPVKIGFDSSVQRIPGMGTFLRLKDGMAIRIEGLPTIFAEGFERASTITIENGHSTIGPVAISGSAKAMRAMNTCAAEQLAEWGADPAQFQPGGMPAAPKAHPDSWLAPAQLMKLPFAGDRIDIVLKLSITPGGVVDGCEQVAGLPNKRAGEAACKMLHGKLLYMPARDPAGLAVRGAGSHRIQLIRRVSIG